MARHGRFRQTPRMDDVILFERQGPIGILTLNRPERLNAINHQMLRALRAFFDERHRDYGCRVIVVTGAGRGFCAGADMGTLNSIADAGREDVVEDPRSKPGRLRRTIGSGFRFRCSDRSR